MDRRRDQFLSEFHEHDKQMVPDSRNNCILQYQQTSKSIKQSITYIVYHNIRLTANTELLSSPECNTST